MCASTHLQHSSLASGTTIPTKPLKQRIPHQRCPCSPKSSPRAQPITVPFPSPFHPTPLPATHHRENAKSSCHPRPHGSPGSRVGWHGSPASAAHLGSCGAAGPARCPGSSADISAVSCPWRRRTVRAAPSPEPPGTLLQTPRAMESVALYSFQATEEDELPFQKGDTLKVPAGGVG